MPPDTARDFGSLLSCVTSIPLGFIGGNCLVDLFPLPELDPRPRVLLPQPVHERFPLERAAELVRHPPAVRVFHNRQKRHDLSFPGILRCPPVIPCDTRPSSAVS